VDQKWIKKLKNYKKFREFHGCELVMILPNFFGYTNNNHQWGYAKLLHGGSDFTVHGITPIVFEISILDQFFNLFTWMINIWGTFSLLI